MLVLDCGSINLSQASGQTCSSKLFWNQQIRVDAVLQGEGMRAAELVVWVGDFNYRIDEERNAVVSSIRSFLKDPARNRAYLQDLIAKVRWLQPEPAVECGKAESSPWPALRSHANMPSCSRLAPDCSNLCFLCHSAGPAAGGDGGGTHLPLHA